LKRNPPGWSRSATIVTHLLVLACRRVSDLEGQAHYYKKYYNSAEGKASEEEYIKLYKDTIF
jgi:hypothetical protein